MSKARGPTHLSERLRPTGKIGLLPTMEKDPETSGKVGIRSHRDEGDQEKVISPTNF